MDFFPSLRQLNDDFLGLCSVNTINPLQTSFPCSLPPSFLPSFTAITNEHFFLYLPSMQENSSYSLLSLTDREPSFSAISPARTSFLACDKPRVLSVYPPSRKANWLCISSLSALLFRAGRKGARPSLLINRYLAN